MAKNILVITGSPRKNGNSEALAGAFIKGALKNDNRVTQFNAAELPVQPCRACDACWSTGKPCVFKDGFDELGPLLEEAEVAVFVSPLYFYGLSAQIKAAIDKMYSYMAPCAKRKISVSSSYLLMCGGDADMALFDGAVTTYRNIAGYMKWKDAGVLIVPAAYEKGSIHRSELLQKAYDLGKSIY